MYIYSREPDTKSSRMYLGLVVTLVSSLGHVLTADDFQFPDLSDRLELSPEKSMNVIEGLKKIGDMFDKAEEHNKKGDTGDCRFKCPEGLTAIAKPKHKVYPDGCGSPDNKFDFPVVPEIDKCCDTHDICYGTFGEEKKNCDRNLQKCLKAGCKEAMKALGRKDSHKQGCSMMSKLILGSVMSSSCQEYKILQEKATLCQADTDGPKSDVNIVDDNLMENVKPTSDVDLKEKSKIHDDINDDFLTVEVENDDIVDDEDEKDVVHVENDVQQRDEL
ncbi:uncharacterized protein LOC117109901 isoform X2 [Anneissia japonica]|nr:uncharacterized protein LOC117109901 isoform X2 [Anneissia japonica]